MIDETIVTTKQAPSPDLKSPTFLPAALAVVLSEAELQALKSATMDLSRQFNLVYGVYSDEIGRQVTSMNERGSVRVLKAGPERWWKKYLPSLSTREAQARGIGALIEEFDPALVILSAQAVEAQRVSRGMGVKTVDLWSNRLVEDACDVAAPGTLKTRDKEHQGLSSISNHYSADLLMQDYAGTGGQVREIPGYWMHGWLPPSFNREHRLIALHKTTSEQTSDRLEYIAEEKRTVPQWVSREDQAICLRGAGYAQSTAIGLPFVYLPEVSVARRSGSLLVMPPHGQKRFFDPILANAYADEIAALKGDFSEILVCVTLRDYYRNEWRSQFQRRGIGVFYGSSTFQPNTLLRMKEIFSSFEYVTSNAFGSQLAYAAHCGAKVSVFGAYVGWAAGRSTYATKLYPDVAATVIDLHSEAGLRRDFPFLFRHPGQATTARPWGDWQVGLEHKRSPAEIRSLFGWADGSADK